MTVLLFYTVRRFHLIGFVFMAMIETTSIINKKLVTLLMPGNVALISSSSSSSPAANDHCRHGF